MRSLVVVIAILVLAACGDLDNSSVSRLEAEKLFSEKAVSVQPSELHALRAGRVSCMHCPYYFSFATDPTITNKIISKHGLQEMNEISSEIRQIEQLVRHDVSWWEMAAPQEQDKIYWVARQPKQANLGGSFRLLVVKKKNSYFVTSGHAAVPSDSGRVEITLSSPQRCEIGETHFDCGKVAEYLRDELKLPADTALTVTWSFYKDKQKYVDEVINQLRAVGYRNIMSIGFEEDPFAQSN